MTEEKKELEVQKQTGVKEDINTAIEENLQSADKLFKDSDDNDLDEKIQFHLRQKIQNISGIRHAILVHVIQEEYKRSKEEIKQFVEMKKSFTAFVIRTEPYVKHCLATINTIKTKRQFLQIRGALNRSKQKEIFKSILDHFDELKNFLTKVMEIAKEEDLNDLRSTVFVLKVLSLCIFSIFVVSFMFLESVSMLKSFYIIIDGIAKETLNKILSALDLL